MTEAAPAPAAPPPSRKPPLATREKLLVLFLALGGLAAALRLAGPTVAASWRVRALARCSAPAPPGSPERRALEDAIAGVVGIARVRPVTLVPYLYDQRPVAGSGRVQDYVAAILLDEYEAPFIAPPQVAAILRVDADPLLRQDAIRDLADHWELVGEGERPLPLRRTR